MNFKTSGKVKINGKLRFCEMFLNSTLYMFGPRASRYLLSRQVDQKMCEVELKKMRLLCVNCDAKTGIRHA